MAVLIWYPLANFLNQHQDQENLKEQEETVLINNNRFRQRIVISFKWINFSAPLFRIQINTVWALSRTSQSGACDQPSLGTVYTRI